MGLIGRTDHRRNVAGPLLLAPLSLTVAVFSMISAFCGLTPDSALGNIPKRVSLVLVLCSPPGQSHPLCSGNDCSDFGFVLSVLELHIKRIIQFVLFCIRFFLLRLMPLRFIQVAVCISSLLFFLAKYYSIVEIGHDLLMNICFLLIDIWVVSSFSSYK